MGGMIIYTLQRDARTMLTGRDFAIPFIQRGPIYCKTSDTEPKIIFCKLSQIGTLDSFVDYKSSNFRF